MELARTQLEAALGKRGHYLALRLIEPQPDCWVWSGNAEGGYGRIYIDGKRVRVHRVIYEALVGPIPEGHELDHLCRIKACCNPAHLQPVTHTENVQRSPLSKVSKHLPQVGVAGPGQCYRLHELTPENTYTRPDGQRECRSCRRERHRKRRELKRLNAA